MYFCNFINIRIEIFLLKMLNYRLITTTLNLFITEDMGKKFLTVPFKFLSSWQFPTKQCTLRKVVRTEECGIIDLMPCEVSQVLAKIYNLAIGQILIILDKD